MIGNSRAELNIDEDTSRSLIAMTDITDGEMLEAVRDKLAYIGTDFAPAIKAMIVQHMAAESANTLRDVRKIPQDRRAAFLEKLRNF
jgi:hypothetical protein